MGAGKVAAISSIGIAALSGLAWTLKRFLRSKNHDDLDSEGSISSNLLHLTRCLSPFVYARFTCVTVQKAVSIGVINLQVY